MAELSHLLREVGGRKLPYAVGTPAYEKDPYRGQRRRPWMCFRVGTPSMDFTSEHFVVFLERVYKSMLQAGLLLDDEKHVLKVTCTDHDYDYLKQEIDEGLRKCAQLYDPGPLSVPIVILVLNRTDRQTTPPDSEIITDINELTEISDIYNDRIYLFKIERDEIMQWDTEMEYFELDRACNEFADYLAQEEGLVESLACPMSPEEINYSFGRGLDDLSGDNIEEDAHHLDERMKRELEFENAEQARRNENLRLLRQHSAMNEAPPGLGPPGISTAAPSHRQFETCRSFGRKTPVPPPPGLDHAPPPGLQNAPPPGLSIPPPPGIGVSRPPGLPAAVASTSNNRANSTFSASFSSGFSPPPTDPKEEPEEEEIVGDHILSHEDVCAALGVMQNFESTSRGVPTPKHTDLLAKHINGTKLYERFDHPFVNILPNLDLLIVVNYSMASRAKECQEAAKKVIRGIYSKEYPIKLRKKFLDRLFASGQWSDDAATLFFQIVILYFNTARYRNGFMLSIEKFLPSWEELWSSYDMCDKNALVRIGVTDEEFKNMDKLIGHINKWIKKAKSATGDSPNITLMETTTMTHDAPCSSRQSHQVSHNSSDNQADSANVRKNEARNQELYRQQKEVEARRLKKEEIERARRLEEDRLEQIRRAREEEYFRQAQEEEAYRRRIEKERMGFRNGGGTVELNTQFDEDGDPIIDISDSTIDERDIKKEPEEVDLEDDVTAAVEADVHVVNTDEKPKQPYPFVDGYDDGYEPPWMKCEKIEPPEDFKTLTSVPTMSDYVNPTEPYLRRIQELGVYKSAHHYLDVQFRLLREDLVSPMRDGLSIYRRNGTCKGNRKENEPCSDISVFNITRVDGKQVTEREGTEMRIIWPATYDISNLLENDREMKELGLVMLSCDRFVEDFHLGHIQSSRLVQKGCLHLVVHEETRPFKANTSYLMVQATSYLPSYKHVLQNLKTMSPFRPIPFERYIVHGRKEIFRPYFHQYPKSEEQVEEEKRLTKIYSDIRSMSAAKRYMSGKSIPKGVDDDNDCYEYTKMNEPKKEEQDLEYLQLREPIFRDLIGVDTGGSDHININRKWYKISRLLDDFHPKNMDESQRIAFCNTFKHELSIIQGPPGTGKTHIGVEIIKTMLHNRSHWRMTEPILVVCFTNSGLDNLLERIYQMIEDDEELSKDNGKPKMIRYGMKCESDYLKRRNVMRYDAHDQYRPLVSEASQRETQKANVQKRKKGDDLILSSYTLYVARNDLLSYFILSRVMHPKHQEEINAFAYEHVDSKEQSLNGDEAIACWLLDRDFGKATKAQTKKSKKNKFQESNDSEDEDKQALTVDYSDDEDDDEEMDDEKRLDKLFKKMNVGCSGKDLLGMISADDEYHTKGTWEIAHDYCPPEVMLMGKKSKSSNHSVDEHINSLVREVKDMILSTPPLQKHELEDVKYIFSLPRPKRWALYVTWCDAVRNLVVEGLPKQITAYRAACDSMQRAQDHFDSEIMKLPMIIGLTTTGCSRLRPVIESVEPRVLVVEEAAEVLEAHILSAMISTVEHCVMIGDHKQLRPNPAVHELGVEYGMRISMFERLVERGLPYSQLREQHRMNLLISDTIVKTAFYDNVVDAENVADYPDVEGMDKNLYFWSHSHAEETPDGISWLNRREAEMTVALVRHLLKQNYTTHDIVVLATYAAQRQYMYREYPSVFGLTSDGSLIPVETVDSFQGRERKIAIVSLVRSHRGKAENTGIGFLAVANRICVALTRAQHGMYIIGNGAYIMHNSELWKKIVGQLDRKKLIDYEIPLKCMAHRNVTYIKNPSDFAELSPEGGCLEICNIPKKCGHVCKRPCHPKIEYEHSLRCEYPCQLTCPNPQYNHKCTRLCSEDCGSCMRPVEIVLECGHLITTPCSRIQLAQCDQSCKKRLECGHKCPARCGTQCISRSECEELVTLDLECGHKKQMRCNVLLSEDADTSCIERCENRMLTCQHQCKELCGAACTVECQEIVSVDLPCRHSQDVVCSSYLPDRLDLIPCTALVPKSLIPCGHTEMIQCSQEPSTDLCTRPCTKVLKTCGHMCSDKCGTCFLTQNHICQQMCQQVLECGHNCSARCGEKCPPCKAYCPNSCVHQSCGVAGDRTYGRDCSALCVLCTNNCANKCIHRSCTKKCFEECDVKTCTEPCMEKLKCSHACLGLCGEICPRVCGTCERQHYNECVAKMPSSSRTIHRLIMIPKCRHIVPVEELDDHVKKLKERGRPLTCCNPKCNSSLIGILRYAKYNKKFYLEENMKKMKQKVGNIHQSTLDQKLRDVINDSVDEIRSVITNMSDEKNKIVDTFKQNIKWLSDNAEEYRGKADQKWRIAFLLNVGKCFKAIAKIVSMTSKQRLSSRKDIPPILDTMIIQSFGTQPFFKILDELRDLNEFLYENAKAFMIGAILPRMRMHLFRMAGYQVISAVLYQLCIDKQGVSDQLGKALYSRCQDLLQTDDRMNSTVKLEYVEQAALQMVPKLQNARKYYTWTQLDVPEL